MPDTPPRITPGHKPARRGCSKVVRAAPDLPTRPRPSGQQSLVAYGGTRAGPTGDGDGPTGVSWHAGPTSKRSAHEQADGARGATSNRTLHGPRPAHLAHISSTTATPRTTSQTGTGGWVTRRPWRDCPWAAGSWCSASLPHHDGGRCRAPRFRRAWARPKHSGARPTTRAETPPPTTRSARPQPTARRHLPTSREGGNHVVNRPRPAPRRGSSQLGSAVDKAPNGAQRLTR